VVGFAVLSCYVVQWEQCWSAEVNALVKSESSVVASSFGFGVGAFPPKDFPNLNEGVVCKND
jgi:hypothetical protein